MEEKPKPSAPATPPVSSTPAAKRKTTVDEDLRAHLEAMAKLDVIREDHLLVTEHAAAAELEPWQLRALLARFHAHGLRDVSRIHPDAFKAALDEALKGRI